MAMAESFMAQFFQRNADKMPNPAGCSERWHLPSNMVKEDVYHHYTSWCDAHKFDDPPVSFSAFAQCWVKNYSHVTIPSRGRFKECTT